MILYFWVEFQKILFENTFVIQKKTCKIFIIFLIKTNLRITNFMGCRKKKKDAEEKPIFMSYIMDLNYAIFNLSIMSKIFHLDHIFSKKILNLLF